MSNNLLSHMPAPVCLIKNTGDGLQTVESSLNLLRGIKQPVVVVAVVGLYRTGKSYLMNRLAGQSSGFALGSTIESMTKGIWMWCVPHPSEPDHTLVLLDTEGLGDVEKGNSKNDDWIFCLAVLLSSTLVYNSSGTIDNQAIEKLHYVTDLTKRIRVKSVADDNEEDSQFVRFFPSFVWAVRDFILERKINGRDVSEDGYLDFALKLKTGWTEEAMKYNLPRGCIRNFFPTRKCFTFPFPTSTNKMKNLDSIPVDDLDPEFLEVADRFCTYIAEESRVKHMQGGYEVTGSRLSHLVKIYVDTINSGSVPCLENAVNALAEIENQSAVNEGFRLYELGMERLKKDFPVDSGSLLAEHQRLVDEAEKEFHKRSFNDEGSKYFKKMTEDVARLYEQLGTQNEEASVKFCKKLLFDEYAPITAKIQQKTYTKAGGYEIYCHDRDAIVARYRQHDKKGMKAEEVLKEFLQEKNSDANTILTVDERLTEADKKMAATAMPVRRFAAWPITLSLPPTPPLPEAQEQAKLQEQKEEVLKQRQEELQRHLEEEQRHQEERMKRMEEKMEEERRLHREELSRAIDSKLKEQKEMMEKRFKDKVEIMDQEIKQLKREKEQQKTDAGNCGVQPFSYFDTLCPSVPSEPFAELKGTEKVKNVKRGEDIILSWESNTGVYCNWRKGVQLLVNDDKINMKQIEYKVFTLTIRYAREEDEGEYSLEVWNKRGTKTGSVQVKLLEYNVDWRTIDWEEYEILKRVPRELKPRHPEVKHLRFLLHGYVGVGKSSIINSINCVFQGRMNNSAFVSTFTGITCTKTYKTHPIKDEQGGALPFVFNDTMGCEKEGSAGVLTDDIISALRGHVREGYKFNPLTPVSEGDHGYISSPSLNDKVHCLVSVIPAHKVTMLAGDDGAIEKMKKVREAAGNIGIPQVVFLTHVDLCCPLVNKDLKHIYSSKKIKKTMQHCSNILEVPMNCIFPVKNYSEENKVDNKIDSLILDALKQAVNFANDYVEGI